MASVAPISLALTTILAVVLCGCLAADYGWQPQREFSFTIQGQDAVGLPQLKPQYAGFHYQGELRVQTHSSRVLLLKFFNMNYYKIHEELPEGWWKGAQDPLKSKTKQLPITTSTVIVKMTKSKSPELVMQSGLDEWQVNFIKGVVSHLMVFLSDDSRAGNHLNKLTNSQTSDVYSVFEDSVSGRCEVMYEISPLLRQQAPDNKDLCQDRQLWEITKTRNFSNCQVLSEDHAHLPTRDCTPGGANCGSFWTRASLTQMIGCGEMNNFLLLRSVSSTVKSAQLHLTNNTQAVVNSNLNITLDSVLDLKSKFNSPQMKQSMQSLLYSYSATPKEISSRKCQKELRESDEADDSHEHVDFTKQMNPTKEDDKKDNNEPNKSAFRNRRSISYKINKYRTAPNELQNEEDSDENQKSSKGNSKSYTNGKTVSKKRVFNRYRTGFKSSDENSKFNSEEKDEQPFRKANKYGQSDESNDNLSEETNNQHFEEMDLEEYWKISSKDMKNVPPHQPFNLFALAHRNSYDLSCLNTKLQQLVSDIASDLKEINILPEKNTMDKVSMAVDICRSLLFEQLSAISEEVFEIHNGASNTMKKDERRVFRDVITMCGSHPAFKVIKGWVERQQVEGEEAAQIIAALPNHIFSPNKYLIQDFFDMVQQIAEKDDHQLTTTAVLSFSNLVRSACINQASRQHRFSSILKPVCDESYIAHYIDWLSHKISSDAPLRRAYIEALGNVGSSHIIDILKSIAVNPTYSSYYRTSAVFAMRYQALRRNPDMAPLLMSLYHNYSMPASVRIASVALLVYSDPGLAIWQRLAISTWYEPSSAVAEFVSSSIHNIARSTDYLYSHMTKAAALVVPLARPMRISAKRPFNLMTSALSGDLEKLVTEQLSWMQFNDFSNIYYRHSSRYSGFSRTNIEASFSVSNPDDLWSALQDLIYSTYAGIPKSRDLGATHTISDIQDKLKLHTRTMPSLQAELHLKINNIVERMILINKDTLESLREEGQQMILEILREGKSFSYQKTDMDSFHISTTTEMGFPVEFSVRTPWILRSKTELNATMGGLAIERAFMYSGQMQSSVSVMSPWDNIAHIAGAYATNFVQLPPVRVVASIDSASDSIKLTTNHIDQHRLLYFNIQPFTSQKKIKVHQPVLLSPDTMLIKIGESVQVPISGMGRLLNTVYSSERPEHFNILDFWKQARGVVGFPMLFVNMEPRSFETVMNSLTPLTLNISSSMASKSMGNLEFDSPKNSLISTVLRSLDQITSLGQSPVMSAFRWFGGLFGGKDESTTTENPSGDKKDNSQTIQKHSENSSKENNSISKNGDDSSEAPGNNPKDQVSTSIVKVEGKTPAPQVYAVTYESAVGNFNASQVDPFSSSIKDNGASYLLDQVLSNINSGSAVVYAIDIQSAVPDGPKPKLLSAYVAYASTYSRRVNRFGLFVKREQSQTKLTAVHEDPVDISSDLKRRVNEDLKHNLFLDYVHSTSNQNIKAFMKVKLGVSRNELVKLRSSPLLESCSRGDAPIEFNCQKLKEETQQISFGNLTVYYSNDAKFLENMVVKYLNVAKVSIPGTEEKSGEGSNTMSMLVDIDQKTRSVEMLVSTPVTSAKVHNLALSKLPMATFVEWATQPDTVSEYCGVSPNRFRTFDGGESLYKMTDSWHLVLHDRTRKYGISVLAKPSNNNSMVIEVNKDDMVVVRVEEGPKVYVNGQLQPLDVKNCVMVVTDRHGRVVMHAVYTPDSSFRLQLPDDHLDLRYTGSSLVVRAGPALQGRLCGICGAYSNAGAEQYLTAKGPAAKSAKEFAASFQLRGNESPED